jgi:hypothetical protein
MQSGKLIERKVVFGNDAAHGSDVAMGFATCHKTDSFMVNRDKGDPLWPKSLQNQNRKLKSRSAG